MDDARRFERVSELFAEAVSLPANKRSGFLDDTCGDDRDLRSEIEQLIQLDQTAPLAKRVGGLDDELAKLAVDLTIEAESAPAVPERIGGYRILGELGHGGMGVVYRAEQAQPRRTVALKLIRSGLMDERVLRRFGQEAEVLGLLHHPGIAQIYEASTAGADDEAVPFFAMELVDGESLTDYARNRNLGLDARLELLIAIGEAVHHAHQKGVIHRDLKPANLLVTSTGQPKVLDFGVARAIDADQQRDTLHTDARQIVGTLPYMSPEQITGDARGIDIRSDVYSLGVVGFELLTGSLPYDVGDSIPQAAFVIAESEPRRLSAHDRALRGDLDTIFGKALEKDRGRRYQSASEFVDELARYLRHEPIEARSPSALYQLEKFARRHRGLVAGLVVSFVILIGSAIGMALLTLRAREAERIASERASSEASLRRDAERARDRADRERRIATAVNAFLNRMFASPDPWKAEGDGDREISVLDVLDRAARELDDAFDGMDDVEAELRSTFGNTYLSLRKHKRAETQLRAALELQRRIHGERSREAMVALRAYTEVLVKSGSLRDADQTSRDLVTGHIDVYGATAYETLRARFTRVEVLFALNSLDEASRIARESYEIALEHHGREHELTLRARGDLGVVLLNIGELEEAEALQREALAICRARYEDPNPETLGVLNNLAGTLWRREKRAEAEKIVREVIDGRTEIFGAAHPSTLNAMNSLIVFLNARGSTEESTKLRIEQLRATTENLGATHPLTLTYRHNYAASLRRQRQLDEAEKHCVAVLEARRTVLPQGHEQTLLSLELLGLIHLGRGRAAEAEPLLREAVDTAEDSLPKNHWLRPWLATQYGRCLTALKRYPEAEARLTPAVKALRDRFGENHSRTRTASAALAHLHRVWDKKGR